MNIEREQNTLIYLLDYHLVNHDLGPMTCDAQEVEDYMATFTLESLISSGVVPRGKIVAPVDQDYWCVAESKGRKQQKAQLQTGAGAYICTLDYETPKGETYVDDYPYENFLKFSAGLWIRHLYMLKCIGTTVFDLAGCDVYFYKWSKTCRVMNLRTRFMRMGSQGIIYGWGYRSLDLNHHSLTIPQVVSARRAPTPGSKTNFLKALKHVLHPPVVYRVTLTPNPLACVIGNALTTKIAALSSPNTTPENFPEFWEKLIHLEAMREYPELYVQAGSFLATGFNDALMTYELTPADVQYVLGITKKLYEEAVEWKSKLFRDLMAN